MLKIIFMFVAFVPCSISKAEEPPCKKNAYAIVGKFLKLKKFSGTAEGGVVVDAACKIWSYNNQITIAAFGYVPPDSTENDQKKNIVVALIDIRKNSVVSSNLRTIHEDATTEVGPGSLKLDLARYQLNEKNRAIGLRFYSLARGASCGEANWNNELILYSPESKVLRPVLQIYMSQQRAFSGCIGAATGNDSGEYTELSISMEKTKSNDFNDLNVTASIEPYFSVEALPSSEKSQRRIEHFPLKYNGKNYVDGNKNVPWWMGHY